MATISDGPESEGGAAARIPSPDAAAAAAALSSAIVNKELLQAAASALHPGANVAAPAGGPESFSSSSAAELISKAIAPVKTQFLSSVPPVRSSSSFAANGKDSISTTAISSILLKDKKSRRQLKRERKEERKSALNICPEVAKNSDPKACQYEENCRFSHDLESFLAQKQDDLPGICPFLHSENSGYKCPYGVACRYAGTHKYDKDEASCLPYRKSEKNGLSKDVQRLLWKNQMSFPKADVQLASLGLSVHKSTKRKIVEKEKQCEGSPKKLCCSDVHREGHNEAIIVTPDDKSISEDELAEKDELGESIVDDDICLSTTCNNSDKENGSTNGAFISELHGSILLENGKQIGPLTPCANALRAEDTFDQEVYLDSKANDREKKLVDFRGKLYLAPLTTVGNLPFRRTCKVLGADITCGEMAMCTNLLQGQASEWALLRRHSSEELFGVQICGAFPDTVARTVELIERECSIDFIDINMGCPIDIVVNKGAGSALLTKPMRMKNIVQVASGTADVPITIKVRTGYLEGRNRVDSLIADFSDWGARAVTIHGRSRQQRYSKLADWDYIYQCAGKASDRLQVLGNGDVFSYTDWNKHVRGYSNLSTCMIARGALIKPWLFTEIKEERHWDITAEERFNILKDYVRFGLEHWGSDSKGVETTRYFLLEWLSYTYRYIPVGLLDVIPQRLNWRPPSYFGRNDLETLMASESAADWIRISEMLLGPVPSGFTFAPKHKSNAYDKAENG